MVDSIFVHYLGHLQTPVIIVYADIQSTMDVFGYQDSRFDSQFDNYDIYIYYIRTQTNKDIKKIFK